jgi:hypothetical protein
MKPVFFGVLAALFFSGCMYLDHPPVREISGRVVQDAVPPAPVTFRLYFCSGRKFFSPLPFDTFGIDADAKTDRQGRFFVRARLNADVKVIVESLGPHGKFTLPKFPPSNRLEGLILKISKREP